MSQPTSEQIAKLPKWAQEHIESLSREARTWKESALRFSKEQPESPFFMETYNEEMRKQFITSPSSSVSFKHAGVEGTIYLTCKGDSQRPFGVELTFHGDNQLQPVGIFPAYSNCLYLVAKENMR